MPWLTERRRLERLAAELEAERAPWWVNQPGGQTPAQGWWWMPRGTRQPQFLGHNHIVAYVALQRLADAEHPA